ncbi:hypothetical protein ACFSHQ_13430 [Gemmobacter lanyuensis]
MPRITVRAKDSALAMDEVLDRLGPDAYILSTRHEQGMVVIEAASDAAAADPRPQGGAFQRRNGYAGSGAGARRSRSDFARELHGQMQEPAAETSPPPGPARRRSGWLICRPICSARRRRPPLPIFCGCFPEGEVWPSDRLVLCGPLAEDRVQAALRIAAAWRKADAGCRPQLIEALTHVPFRETALRSWSRLLGLDHVVTAEGIFGAHPGAPQLVCVPWEADPVEIMALTRAEGEVLLVLPAGLHPRRLSRLIAPWRGSGAGVCLCGLTDEPPQPEELMLLAQAGLVLRLTGWGSDLMDALDTPGSEDLRDWAQIWCDEAGLTLSQAEQEVAA